MPAAIHCRVCEGPVGEFLDLGTQPLSDAFVDPGDTGREFFYRLAAGLCEACGMVQLTGEVPRELMFHAGYPYRSSGSAVMRSHFEDFARRMLDTELTGPDPFAVEIGCNDGAMIATISAAGVRHLGVEPSVMAGEVASSRGVKVHNGFFDDRLAADIHERHGPANVIYAANTLCHIPYVDSVFRGIGELLAPDGIFVFEDPYLGDIVKRTAFDQIYDEHFFLFSVRSVHNMVRCFGFELVDIERLPVHGGEIRYTVARPGTRRPTASVAATLAEEDDQRLTDPGTLARFERSVRRIRDDLTALLSRLRDEGKRVVGYGATAKSATVTNYCGIGPDLVPFVCDTTPAKQGLLAPGSHIPVKPPDAFAAERPDYALLFAWNHAAEIMAKEQAFRAAGGQWILYVPEVHVV